MTGEPALTDRSPPETTDPEAVTGSTLPTAFEAYAAESLPQAPAAGPGKDGLLEVVLAREGDGPTRLVRDRTRVPYHLTGTLETDPAPGLTTLLAQEPTGGVAQGDRHRVRVDAREGARGHLTTQGATKVHRMRGNYAHLDVSLRAGPGAHLEYLPGATILNEGSRCLQTVTVDLAPDAVVLVGDVLVPDGLSHHEPFSFDHYHGRLEATCDGRLCCADVVDLRPADRDPRDPAGVGEFGVVGTLTAFAPAADASALADAIVDRLEAAETEADDLLAGASTLADGAGVVTRVLGDGEAAVSAAIGAAWDESRLATLGVGAPADRRY